MRCIFEIGLEELPARLLNSTLNSMEKIAKNELKNARLGYDNLNLYGTARRLVLEIKGLSKTQDKLIQTFVGPSKETAFLEDGSLAEAGKKFLDGHSMTHSNVKLVSKGKGEYIAVEKELPTVATLDILPEVFKNTILQLQSTFDKPMVWDDSAIKFIRPIRWVLAILNDTPIEFNIGNLKSGCKTRGHRFFGSNDIKVRDAADYFLKMKENYVMLDINNRKQHLIESLNSVLVNGEILKPHDRLLTEVTNLVEYPNAVVCEYDPSFLKLPHEVIVTTIEDFQQCFPVFNSSLNLLPKFIFVRDGDGSSENIRLGNEKVLLARLSDALFFYNKDKEKALESYVPNLKAVVFQKDTGNFFDKTSRLQNLTLHIAELLQLNSEEKETLNRAAYLSKADITTSLVSEKEYSDLRGVIGGVYAELSDEIDSVCLAITEQYMPVSFEDAIPGSKAGAILSIADKIDNIVGALLSGATITGAHDPYYLRREAFGIIRIILGFGFNIELNELLNFSIELYKKQNLVNALKGSIKEELITFFKGRLESLMLEQNFNKEIVNSVVAVSWSNILVFKQRLESLQKFLTDENAKSLILLVKRIRNIVKDFNSTNVNENLFIVPEEKELYLFYLKFNTKLSNIESTSGYSKFFDEVLTSSHIIDNFFNKVRIMDDNTEIKNNRLALLKNLDVMFNSIANLSMVNI